MEDSSLISDLVSTPKGIPTVTMKACGLILPIYEYGVIKPHATTDPDVIEQDAKAFLGSTKAGPKSKISEGSRLP